MSGPMKTRQRSRARPRMRSRDSQSEAAIGTKLPMRLQYSFEGGRVSERDKISAPLCISSVLAEHTEKAEQWREIRTDLLELQIRLPI